MWQFTEQRAHKTIRGCIYPCKWRCKNEIIFQFSLNGFTFVVIAAPCLAARHPRTRSNEDVEEDGGKMWSRIFLPKQLSLQKDSV